MTEPVTVREHYPTMVRALRNGNDRGSGLRVYVPAATTKEFGLQLGDVWRATRMGDGTIRLTSMDVRVERDSGRVRAGAPAQERMHLQLTQREARALEDHLARTARGTPSLIGLGKRIRRRMRRHGWDTPDRADDHLERAS